MTDKTTETFRSLMETTFDIAPQTPELPQVTERHATPRPILAMAGGFAAVLLFVGAGAALLAQSDSGGVAVGSQATAVDTPVLIVYFGSWISEPPEAVVESLLAHPDIIELIASDVTEEEAMARSHMAAEGSPDYEPKHQLLATIRVRVASNDAAKTVNAFAEELEGVIDIDAYFGAADMYPDLTYEGDIGLEDLTIYEDSFDWTATTTTTVTAP